MIAGAFPWIITDNGDATQIFVDDQLNLAAADAWNGLVLIYRKLRILNFAGAGIAGQSNVANIYGSLTFQMRSLTVVCLIV